MPLFLRLGQAPRPQRPASELPLPRVRAITATPERPRATSAPGPAPTPCPSATVDSDLLLVRSRHVGWFWPCERLLRSLGAVKRGQSLGVVRVLGMEFAVLVPHDGVLLGYRVVAGAPVEYGLPLADLRRG